MIEVTEYNDVNIGFLIGRLTISIKKWGDFIIRDVAYFKKENTRWVVLPSRKYHDEASGEKKYVPYVAFKDPSMTKKFQEQILKSLDDYFKINNHEVCKPIKNEFVCNG